MGKNNRRGRRLSAGVLILIVIAVMLTLIAGVLAAYFYLPWQTTAAPEITLTEAVEQPSEDSAPETAQTEAAAPEVVFVPVVTADGRSGSPLCKASYTAADASDAAKTVAVFGEEKLTNGALQVLYLSEVNAYRMAGHEEAPDFSAPLDCQQCPLGDGTASWQHYFLERAIRSWQVQQALIAGSKEPQIITEEAFKPNLTTDLHGTYISPKLPVNDFLYADRECYEPNTVHQAYLDGLEEQLEQLAKNRGFDSLDAYAAETFGAAVKGSEIVEAAKVYNLAYMYFTEYSYNAAVSEEDIRQYISAHADELPDSSERTVDLRQILLIPEGAEVAADGRVTAEETQWDQCRRSAESQLSVIKASGMSYSFAKVANLQSADEGTRINGGLYSGIHPGQMIGELDSWCFEEGRKVNDTAIIRTELGYHIVKICEIHSAAEEAARQALALEQARERWCGAEAEVDYSAVSLWGSTDADAICLEEVLYPDIAHERFPESIVYLQQDFMYAPFGSGDVGHNGCGITAMAMLTTYMTDTIQSPAMMAARFPQYFASNGTDGNIFLYGVIDMGFFPDHRAFSVDDIIPALQNHQPVISIQRKGLFTSTGHYLLLQNYYEEDDTFQVRDSNVYNYGRLEGHKVDAFTRRYIVSGGAEFYIMQPKITRIPACARCGTTFEERAPELLLQQDYCCEKCTAALSRRGMFLSLPDAV